MKHCGDSGSPAKDHRRSDTELRDAAGSMEKDSELTKIYGTVVLQSRRRKLPDKMTESTVILQSRRRKLKNEVTESSVMMIGHGARFKAVQG